MAPSTSFYSIWQSALSNTCLCCTTAEESYTLLEEEEEELPLVTEKTRYRDVTPPPTSRSLLPPTSEQPMTSTAPPVFLPQPQSPPLIDASVPSKRLHRRALLTTSNFHAEEVMTSNTRASRVSKENPAAAITEMELTDNLSAMDALNIAGSSAGFVSTGYAAASYYSQRKAEKEAKRREHDLEAAIRGVEERVNDVNSMRSERESVSSSASSSNTYKEDKTPEAGPAAGVDTTWTGMK